VALSKHLTYYGPPPGSLNYNLSSPQPLVGRSLLSATWDALGSSGCCPLGTKYFGVSIYKRQIT
jgi:hypothetical protein